MCISDKRSLNRVKAWYVLVGTSIAAGVVLYPGAEKDMVGYLTLGNRKGGLTLWERQGRIRGWTTGEVS